MTEISKIMDINLAEILDEYDTPENILEWLWIEREASYTHRDNGDSGIWEFVLNLSRDFVDIPVTLLPIINLAIENDVSYILFHQGT